MSKNEKVEFKVVKVANKADMIVRLLTTELDGKPGFRKTNRQIADEVNKAFEGVKPANTSPAAVAWYASHLKHEVGFAQRFGIEQYQPLMAYKA